jgi:transitional endoplasmic reticulum ATPase
MAIDLPAPTRSRRRSLLEHELHQIVEKEVCAVGDDEFDVGPTAIKSEGFAVDEVRNVVHRAVEAVQNGNEDKLTSDLLSRTAEKLQGERHEELQSEAVAGLFDAPNTTFEDIGGLKRAKQEIRKAVQKPDAWETAYEQWGVSPGKNILLYGLPGTGKTMLARAAANETDRAFIPVNAADVKAGMDELFTHARRNAPSLVFLDEFDSIGGRRGHINHTSDDVVNALLSELDGLGAKADVVVIAATNRPEVLDPALLRPGRFGEHIEVDDPDDEALREIVRLHTAEVPTAEDVTTGWFVESVDVDTGAEVKSICDRAVENALAAADTDDPTMVTVTRDAVLQAASQLATDRVEHSEPAPLEPTFQ